MQRQCGRLKSTQEDEAYSRKQAPYDRNRYIDDEAECDGDDDDDDADDDNDDDDGISSFKTNKFGSLSSSFYE